MNRAIATCYGSNEMLIPSYTATLPLVSTGSVELTMDPNTCTVTWRGAAKVVAVGWMRVASINMTDTSTCPSGLSTLTSPRMCIRNLDVAGCSSVIGC